MSYLTKLKTELKTLPIKLGYQFEISFLNNPYESWPREYKDLFASKVSDYVYDLYQFDVDPRIFNENYKNILSYLKNNLNLNSTEYSMLIDTIDNFKSSITENLEGKKYEYFIDSINEVNNKMTFLKIVCDIFASFTAYNSKVYLLTYENKIYKTPEEYVVYILNDKCGYTGKTLDSIINNIGEDKINKVGEDKEDYLIDYMEYILDELKNDIETYYTWENKIQEVI